VEELESVEATIDILSEESAMDAIGFGRLKQTRPKCGLGK
jgi:hypothetical protein